MAVHVCQDSWHQFALMHPSTNLRGVHSCSVAGGEPASRQCDGSGEIGVQMAVLVGRSLFY